MQCQCPSRGAQSPTENKPDHTPPLGVEKAYRVSVLDHCLVGFSRAEVGDFWRAPGCTGPVDTRICLDERKRPLESLPRTAMLPVGNVACAASFRGFPRPLIELARWGHFQPGMPWERIPEPAEEWA